MEKTQHTLQFSLSPEDNLRLANLCGQYDQHLRQIESYLGVELVNRGHAFQIIGIEASTHQAKVVLHELYAEASNADITPEMVHLALQSVRSEAMHEDFKHKLEEFTIKTSHATIKPRSPNQYYYLKNIHQQDINFGVGPSGTGKTYLAVACAVNALEKELVRRILLVRPAVEAGESLGFLPGDLAEKVNPYLRPLYDALYEMLGTERVTRLLAQNIIEIAPIAFMRGRTLNDAFIILDESQNTTAEQMKMFLTRIGFNSKAVITGDITQVDLPENKQSGLRHAIEILKDIPDISFTFFQAHDVVRHPLVQQIVTAYENQSRKK